MVLLMKKFVPKNKWIFIVLLSSGFFLSTQLHHVFANENLAALFSQWFQIKQEEAIKKIDEAIEIQKERQIDRIKEALQLELAKAEEEMQIFVDEEIEKRMTNIQNYADELIANYDTDQSEDKKKIQEELDRIMDRAYQEMEKVRETYHNKDNKLEN